MKPEYDRKMMNEYDAVRIRLLKSGKDLSRIKIVMKGDATGSYITRRIMRELGEDA